MKNLNYLAIALILSVNSYTQEKIVGGEEVKNFKEASFAVHYGGCAGSVINKDWILTAAHCKGIFHRDVHAGSLDSHDRSLKLDVEKTFVHPKFGTAGLSYDFALMKLKSSIDLKKHNIRPIKMANKNDERRGHQSVGKMATVFGWGLTSEGGLLSVMLRKVQVPIVSTEVANAPESYDGKISDSMIAAGYPEGGKDACQGDSGGPMVTYTKSNRPVLVGVVSWGMGCARALKYGVYSKVSSAQKWIKDTIEKN